MTELSEPEDFEELLESNEEEELKQAEREELGKKILGKRED